MNYVLNRVQDLVTLDPAVQATVVEVAAAVVVAAAVMEIVVEAVTAAVAAVAVVAVFLLFTSPNRGASVIC